MWWGSWAGHGGEGCENGWAGREGESVEVAEGREKMIGGEGGK